MPKPLDLDRLKQFEARPGVARLRGSPCVPARLLKEDRQGIGMLTSMI